jgi:hypothetical protein
MIILTLLDEPLREHHAPFYDLGQNQSLTIFEYSLFQDNLNQYKFYFSFNHVICYCFQ